MWVIQPDQERSTRLANSERRGRRRRAPGLRIPGRRRGPASLPGGAAVQRLKKRRSNLHGAVHPTDQDAEQAGINIPLRGKRHRRIEIITSTANPSHPAIQPFAPRLFSSSCTPSPWTTAATLYASPSFCCRCGKPLLISSLALGAGRVYQSPAGDWIQPTPSEAATPSLAPLEHVSFPHNLRASKHQGRRGSCSPRASPSLSLACSPNCEGASV